jgi:hypothetical protein
MTQRKKTKKIKDEEERERERFNAEGTEVGARRARRFWSWRGFFAERVIVNGAVLRHRQECLCHLLDA